MNETKPQPPRPDPGQALASLSGMMEKLGGIDSIFDNMKSADARGDLVSVKLTILLEHLEVDWEDDPRIFAWEKRHGMKLKRSGKT